MPAATGGGSSAGGMSGGGSNSVIPSGGGSSKDLTKPWPSAGCGKEKPADQVETIPGTRTGYTEYHVTQTGATLGTVDTSKAGERQFFVRVPFDYDQNRPYRIVYVGQGCGAQHAGKTNTYPLFNDTQGGTEQAILRGRVGARQRCQPRLLRQQQRPAIARVGSLRSDAHVDRK